MSDDLVKRYLLIKRGLYYAPDRQGYTGVKERAGRYREVEALGLDGVTAIHEDEAPDFSPACWGDTKIAVLTARIETQAREIERLREAMHMAMLELGSHGACPACLNAHSILQNALAGDSHDQ